MDALRPVEILEMLSNVGKDGVRGYGPMGDGTRQLIAEDLIDVSMEDGGYWKAELTQRGRKRLSAG